MRVAFGRFTLDSAARELRQDGRPCRLSPKAFDLLEWLIERRPAVATKAEILDRIWPGTFVEDANLSVLVADIRRVLEDDPKSPAFIRTVHGRGYAFCGRVDETADRPVAVTDAPACRCWLEWKSQSRPVAAGASVIGRDPACDVWLDAPGVSRRHARLSLAGDTATLEDLASTNGTFVGRQRLSSVWPLEDGDIIVLGTETLRFRMTSGAPAATERVR